ncbi:MAG: MoxR family ATPase [Ruminococcus flavefaciens]|nr:MoxR family ATPase [Ruminococcus flavefaciens]MCM1231079.1 MoxR family ATPase [Ruminococcus flavefaciens]
MNLPFTVTQSELSDILLNISPKRPVFIWGAPGIGKSALVQKFADDVGLPCVSLLGSQLAPEDIIGIPKIEGETSCFMPPKMIARKEPYVLFLDELNACSQEVQKAFYSLIHERRVGEYHLPSGSVVIGAGNRSQDGAIVKTMSTALVNRMFHVQLAVDVNQWLDWAMTEGLHSWVTDYIMQRPSHLFSEPPKTEEPYSTPRSWHMLSDALKEYGAGESDVPESILRVLAYGSVSPAHAGQFMAFVKNIDNKNLLSRIIKGEARFPSDPSQRDVLYFVAQSFRSKLLAELPEDKKELNHSTQNLTHRAKSMIKDLAHINLEIAQLVVSDDDDKALPEWFMIEIVRDLPRLIRK